MIKSTRVQILSVILLGFVVYLCFAKNSNIFDLLSSAKELRSRNVDDSEEFYLQHLFAEDLLIIERLENDFPDGHPISFPDDRRLVEERIRIITYLLPRYKILHDSDYLIRAPDRIQNDEEVIQEGRNFVLVRKT